MASINLAERLAFIGLDESERDELPRIWSLIEPDIEGILDRFYRSLMRHPAMARMLEQHTKGGVDFLKRAQRNHWQAAFTQRIDDTYVDRALRIGKAHARVGLEPRWYLGSYAGIPGAIGAAIASRMRHRGQTVARLQGIATKLVVLDMELAVSVYFDELSGSAQRERSETAARVDAKVRGIAEQIAEASRSLAVGAENVGTLTASIRTDSDDASGISTAVSERIAAIAAASEELAASIGEISRRVNESAERAKALADSAKRTDGVVRGLSETARSIGEVVGLISSIAGQTNLLALNATIEAARAGEAGKGFAVVASEVKGLATQTAKATEEIGIQIGAMQRATDEAVNVIQSIGGMVDDLSAIAAAIAGAVVEQEATVREVAATVERTSHDTGALAQRLLTLSGKTGDADTQAKATVAEAGSLAGQTRGLVDTVGGLVREMRGAA